MTPQVLESLAAGLAVVVPVVAVPLTVFTFYLKGLREQQAGRHADMMQRVELMDASLRRLVHDVANLQRDYATKEEWLRESMWARKRIETLSAAAARIDARLEDGAILASSVPVPRRSREIGALASGSGVDRTQETC